MCHILSMKNEDKEYFIFRSELVQKIETRRKELSLTQENMEDGDWSINVRTYQRIENIETDVTLKNLFYICKKLQMNPAKLFSDLPFDQH